MPKRLLLVLGVSLWLSAVLAGQTGGSDEDSIFALGKTHRVRVSVTREEWDALQTSGVRANLQGIAAPIGGTDFQQPDGRMVHIGGGFGTLFPWVRADFLLNDVEIKGVGLRYKGNSSFQRPTIARPFSANLKVKTDFFGGKEDWDGVETLNFHAGSIDPTLMRETLSNAIFRAAGVPAPRTAYAELTFDVPGLHDNAPGGTFILVENVNKRFLKRVLPPGTGLLMKPEGTRGGIRSQGLDWASYVRLFHPDRDATPHEQQRVMEFAELITQPDSALFREKIGTYLDVDAFLRFVIVHLFLANNDSFVGSGNHNYYLYLDPKDDKFRFIPWDQDRSMNQGRGGNFADFSYRPTSNNTLISRLVDDPAVAQRYRALVKELGETVFTEPVLNKLIAEVERAVPNRNSATKDFLINRAAQMKATIEALPQ